MYFEHLCLSAASNVLFSVCCVRVNVLSDVHLQRRLLYLVCWVVESLHFVPHRELIVLSRVIAENAYVLH